MPQNNHQICCLIESETGDRCLKPAGNAAYNKRIQRTVSQRKLNLHIDNSVSYIRTGVSFLAGAAPIIS